MSTVYSLTVRDAAGSLNSQLTQAREKSINSDLAESERRELQALICIDARTAHLALLEFLSLEFDLPVDKEAELAARGRERGLPEIQIVQDELQSAVDILKRLSQRTDDPYLESVSAKLQKLTGR